MQECRPAWPDLTKSCLAVCGKLSRGPSHPGSEGQVPILPFLSFSSLHLVCPSFTSPLAEKCDPATLVLPVSPLQNKMRHSFFKVLSLLLLPLLLEGEFSKAKDLCLSPSRLYPTPRTVSWTLYMLTASLLPGFAVPTFVQILLPIATSQDPSSQTFPFSLSCALLPGLFFSSVFMTSIPC